MLAGVLLDAVGIRMITRVLLPALLIAQTPETKQPLVRVGLDAGGTDSGQFLGEHRRVVLDGRRDLPAVRDPEPAAQVEVLEQDARPRDAPDDLQHLADGETERFQVEELGTDVAGDPDGFEVPVRRGAPVELERGRCVHAELVLAEARRHVRVGLRVHVGVHADRDRRDDAQAQRWFRRRFRRRTKTPTALAAPSTPSGEKRADGPMGHRAEMITPTTSAWAAIASTELAAVSNMRMEGLRAGGMAGPHDM